MTVTNSAKIPDETSKQPNVAIVLGNGIKISSEGKIIGITFDSKLRVLVGGMLASEGKAKKIIFTGGKTAGPNYPSEAQMMKKYFLKEFPNLKRFPVILEESSIDTFENARFVAEKLTGNQEPVTLITNDYHMSRAAKIFEHHGFEIEKVPVENKVDKRSRYYKNLMRQYSKSYDIKKKRFIELGLRGIMKFDPEGRWITEIARRLRSK